VQGSRCCSDSDKNYFGQDLQDTYKGFDKLPQDCQKFLLEYFNNNPTPRATFRGTRSHDGATFANLFVGQVKERCQTSVNVYDSTETVTTTIHMTVGVVTVTHYTEKATAVKTQKQIAVSTETYPMNNVTGMLQA